MRRTKADRWERIVYKKLIPSHGYYQYLHSSDVVQLLRREHRAVVRMVKSLNRFDHGRYDREDPCGMALYKDGAYIKLNELLDCLQVRAR